MDINPADAKTSKAMSVDEGQRFDVRCNGRTRQQTQRIENTGAILQLAARKFADDEWMAKHEALLEQIRECRVATTEMVDPDRRIDQDHGDERRVRATIARRRRGALARGSLPPSRASRRAASRSTSARRASFRTIERSLVPAAALAAFNRASSRVTVVRMFGNLNGFRKIIHHVVHQMMRYLVRPISDLRRSDI